jgi:HEAT repeat protein
LLKDGDTQVRAAAARALGALGKQAQRAIPALLESLTKENRFAVQQQVLQAILLIGSKDMAALLDALRDINEVGRWATPYILKQFGPKAKDAVPHLIRLLGDKESGNRLAAALALGEIGGEARSATPALVAALQDPAASVRAGAAAALAKLDPSREALAKEQFARVMEKGLAAAQLQYDQIMELKIILSVHPRGSHLRLSPFQTEMLADLQREVDQQIARFPPEAIPALVKGINLAAIYRLGFC